jgi:hypothetical protein
VIVFWVYLVLVAGMSLGAGLFLAGKRKKDQAPQRRGGVAACIALLIFSFCMFLSPLAKFLVWIGAWMRDLASTDSFFGWVGLVAIGLVGFAVVFVLFGVGKDLWRDGKPDGPTFKACALSFILVGLFFGILIGSAGRGSPIPCRPW